MQPCGMQASATKKLDNTAVVTGISPAQESSQVPIPLCDKQNGNLNMGLSHP